MKRKLSISDPKNIISAILVVTLVNVAVGESSLPTTIRIGEEKYLLILSKASLNSNLIIFVPYRTHPMTKIKIPLDGSTCPGLS